MAKAIYRTEEKMDNLNKDEIPVWKKVTITKEEAASYSHIGLNKLEELLKIPNCSFVFYVGKKKLINRKEFEDYIATNVEI